jgi:lipid II:glycine glycyltransferase (peptidoglycan interpeptide bridge formation enzyme)
MTTTPPNNKKVQGGYLNISMVDEDEPLTPNRERSNQNFLEEFKQTSQGRRIYDNLDEFFQRIYQYFLEKGFLCIITLRITKLL